MQQKFEAMLDEKPSNWSLRAIYADWLEEHGMEAEADCQRWMVERKKHPHHAYSVLRCFNVWEWYLQKKYSHIKTKVLQPYLFNQLRSSLKPMHYSGCKEYRLRREAEADLAQALQRSIINQTRVNQ